MSIFKTDLIIGLQKCTLYFFFFFLDCFHTLKMLFFKVICRKGCQGTFYKKRPKLFQSFYFLFSCLIQCVTWNNVKQCCFFCNYHTHFNCLCWCVFMLGQSESFKWNLKIAKPFIDENMLLGVILL